MIAAFKLPFFLLCAGFLGVMHFSAQAGVDTTQHDNWVYLNSDFSNTGYPLGLTESFTLQSITDSGPYAGQSYKITSGQPWGGVTTQNQLSINAMAGRQNSTDPADFFNTLRQGAAFTGSDPGPNDLNFAFSGVFTISANQFSGSPVPIGNYNILLGQGSDGAGVNNWWISGPGFTYLQDSFNTGIVTPDGAFLISEASLSNDTFTVKNLTFTSAIPEPSNLIWVGLATLLAFGMRKKRTVSNT